MQGVVSIAIAPVISMPPQRRRPSPMFAVTCRLSPGAPSRSVTTAGPRLEVTCRIPRAPSRSARTESGSGPGDHQVRHGMQVAGTLSSARSPACYARRIVASARNTGSLVHDTCRASTGEMLTFGRKPTGR